MSSGLHSGTSVCVYWVGVGVGVGGGPATLTPQPTPWPRVSGLVQMLWPTLKVSAFVTASRRHTQWSPEEQTITWNKTPTKNTDRRINCPTPTPSSTKNTKLCNHYFHYPHPLPRTVYNCPVHRPHKTQALGRVTVMEKPYQKHLGWECGVVPTCKRSVLGRLLRHFSGRELWWSQDPHHLPHHHTSTPPPRHTATVAIGISAIVKIA